ncbi:MAG TPA: ThiF family adenylyltransferase, partial [Ruminococcus sp.]|nr:ThiF family adenylyltransferase [Ruminococcus sp.]
MIPSREEMYRALEERHGKELQKKLSEAAVAVCGLGGLGSNIAVSLARAGVGELLLIDFDTVDISNLNRQQYFPEQLGLPKTEALSETLRKIAPYCNIRSAQVKLNEENAPELLADVPFI